MKQIKAIIGFVLLTLVLSTSNLFGQIGSSSSQSRTPFAPTLTTGWYGGLGLGFNQYYGDVSEDNFFGKFSNQTKFAIAGVVGKDITPWISLQLDILYSTLYSKQFNFDDGRPANLLFFTDNYMEVGVVAKFYPLKLFLPDNEYYLNPYINTGLVAANWVGNLYDVPNQNLENYEAIDKATQSSGVALAIPLGIGAEYIVNDTWSLFGEGSFRFIFSDKVDRVEGSNAVDVPLHFRFGVTYHLSRLDYATGIRRTSKGRSVKKEKKEDKPKVSIFKAREQEEVVEEDIELNVLEYDQPVNFRDAVKKSLERNKTNQDDDTHIITPDRMRDMINGQNDYRNYILNRNDDVVEETVENVYDQPAVDVETGLNFRVQILATSTRQNIQTLRNKYSTNYRIYEYFTGSIYKYTIGPFASYRDALRYSSQLHDMGIYDAFIVVYRDGEQVPLTRDMKN
jgi:hypothetical protein